jgi:hypothetical protein
MGMLERAKRMVSTAYVMNWASSLAAGNHLKYEGRARLTIPKKAGVPKLSGRRPTGTRMSCKRPRTAMAGMKRSIHTRSFAAMAAAATGAGAKKASPQSAVKLLFAAAAGAEALGASESGGGYSGKTAGGKDGRVALGAGVGGKLSEGGSANMAIEL